MKCELWRRDISAMIDGALDSARRAEVELHLTRCSQCHSFFQDHSRLKQLLETSAPAFEPPEILWHRIEKRIATHDRKADYSAFEAILGWGRIPQVAYGFAATLLLAVTGLVAIQTQDSALMESQYIAALEAYSIDIGENPFVSEKASENPFFDFEDVKPANPFRSGEFPK